MRKNLCRLDELGIDLKEERTKRGWSQRYAAKMIGVSYVNYQNWEQGITRNATQENMEKLKNVFCDEKDAV